jgi:hypothetical protein
MGRADSDVPFIQESISLEIVGFLLLVEFIVWSYDIDFLSQTGKLLG